MKNGTVGFMFSGYGTYAGTPLQSHNTFPFGLSFWYRDCQKFSRPLNVDFLVISLILASCLPVFIPSRIPYLPFGMACCLFKSLPDSNTLNLPEQIYLRLFFK
jgi:hypothetical protein